MILTVSNYGAKSQTTDTLCFPVPVIQKVLIAAKQKQVQDTLINLLRSDIIILQQQADAWQAKDSTNKAIIQTYVNMTGTMQQQRVLLEKEVKKWKRKTTWTAIGGILLTGATAYLLIK